MVLPITRWVRSAACLAIGQVLFVTLAVADTRTNADYIAIVIEAEDHSSSDERWVLTEPDTPAQENDPDPNHSDQAVGMAYLELLPDIRVNHGDEFGPPQAIWDQAGAGPKATYPVDFPEAGRYYVHMRAFSTGTEDNGIHAGLNDEWPDSGERLQFCTAGQGWQWSGRQRDSGGEGPCGAQKTIWVTVPTPGMHTFMVSAREDGFELDRIMLIKDLSNNTRICKPSGSDNISCNDGSLENVDDVVDMAVELEADVEAVEIDDSVSLSVVVRNIDGYDTADQVVLNLDVALESQWDAIAIDEACEIDGDSISCALGQVAPSGPEGEQLFEFTLQPLQSGMLSIPVSIETSSVDGAQANNEVSVSIDVSDEGTLSQLTADWLNTSTPWEVEVETNLTLNLRNAGVADAIDGVITINLPNSLVATDLPANCSGVSTIQCSFPTIAVGEQLALPFGITPASAGFFSASVVATASNQNGEEARATRIVQVADEQSVIDNEEPSSEASTDSGSTTFWLLMLLATGVLVRRSLIVRSSTYAVLEIPVTKSR